VVLGNVATLTAQLRNAGTATLNVTGIALCAGSSAEFGWSPSAPLSIAAGQGTTLTVTYRPIGDGADTGCIAVATNDPARPTVDLQVAGAGSQPPVPSVDADIDIDEFEVPHRVGVSRATSIRGKLHVRNRSNVVGIGTSTLTGTIGGAEVYRQVIPLQVRAREDAEYKFPPYAVAAGSSGTVLWRVTIEDQNADVDVATARTVLGGGTRDDDHEEEEEDDDRSGTASTGTATTGTPTADLTATVPATTGGCSSTGGSVGWLGLVGLGLLGSMRRRRTVRSGP
jgi:MYXO-CTERM domain-containing protein